MGTTNGSPPGGPAAPARPIFDRSLGTAAGLSKLLPTGMTLAFQTMAPSFTRGGECQGHDVNFAFTCGLIGFLTLLSAALNFTDSVTRKDDAAGTAHYGVVTCESLRLFNGGDLAEKDNALKQELEKRRLRREDFLHAVVSAAVFLALAFCDAGVQRCLFKQNDSRWKDFFNHIPLAVGFLASFLFIVFPTTRKGIGDDGASTAAPNETTAAKKEEELKAKTLLGAAATLSKLLPTGTTLAFQTMAPSFTNGGDCAGHRVNFAFTWGLIVILAVMCAVLCFTDSVTDADHRTYYGVATTNGIWLFDDCDLTDLRLSADNDDGGGEKTTAEAKTKRMQEKATAMAKLKRIRPRDFLHAVVSPVVFLAVAFCDAGVQECLVPEQSTQWREFLRLLPLAVAFLASFLFFVFPSHRKGIGEEGHAFCHLDTTATTSARQAGA